MSEWIKCSDRLPKLNIPVLLAYEDDKGVRVGVGRTFRVGNWVFLWHIGGLEYPLEAVTHWMPLPEPPEGE